VNFRVIFISFTKVIFRDSYFLYRNRNLKISKAPLKSAPWHQLIHERCDELKVFSQRRRDDSLILSGMPGVTYRGGGCVVIGNDGGGGKEMVIYQPV